MLWIFSKLGINPLQPKGHLRNTRYNILTFYILPTDCISVICMYVRETIFSVIQHLAFGFCIRVGVCLLHSRDWIFKYDYD